MPLLLQKHLRTVAAGCRDQSQRAQVQWHGGLVDGFLQGLSRSAATTKKLLGHGFAGMEVSDRSAATNHLPTSQPQRCGAHLIRDLTVSAERQGGSAEIGAELLALQRELLAQWNQWKNGKVDWARLKRGCQPMRLADETLQRVVDLGSKRGEQTPWSRAVRTRGQLTKQKGCPLERPEDPGHQTHHQRRREGVAAGGDPPQEQPWRPNSQRSPVPRPSAHGLHLPLATGPRHLSLP